MENSPELTALIRKNGQLFWYTKASEKENLPLPVVLEFFINYADKENSKALFEIVGIKNAAKAFFEQIDKWGIRTNYFSEFQNYFSLYFKKYASRNFNEQKIYKFTLLTRIIMVLLLPLSSLQLILTGPSSGTKNCFSPLLAAL